MTDLGASVRRIASVTATDETFQLRLKFGELTLPRPNVIQLGQEQGVNVDAREGALAAQIEDAAHLDQGEPGRLPASDDASRVRTEASYSRYPLGYRNGWGSRPLRS